MGGYLIGGHALRSDGEASAKGDTDALPDAAESEATLEKDGTGGEIEDGHDEHRDAEDKDEDEDEGEDEDEDEDEDEEEEEEEEEDEDEEEEEPALKYSRLKNGVPQILGRDSASAIDVSPRVIAIGTHNGMVHILTYEGAKVNSFRPHAASVTCLRLDEENDFVATASVEGRVVIQSLTSTEHNIFDYKRPMRCVALEPGFAHKSSRAFVCGGLAGNLILQEKGWLGYKETILHSGEGPIWAAEWRGRLIAWANDAGVKIYDTETRARIGFVDRGAGAPRAELFKCTLAWKDDATLVIAWADRVRVVRVRARRAHAGAAGPVSATGLVGVQAAPQLYLELVSVWEMDCMVAGIASVFPPAAGAATARVKTAASAYVVLAYVPPDTYVNEATDNPAEQRRKAANRPELRIVDRGEEVAGDELAVAGYERYSCSDYALARSRRTGDDAHFVLTPTDVIVVRARDDADHVAWLVERERFAEALEAADKLEGSNVDVVAIGRQYMEHLLAKEEYGKAAELAPRVLNQDVGAWEKWVAAFAKRDQLPAIIPLIPTRQPRLGRETYETVLDYLLEHDKPALLQTLARWPSEVYDIDRLQGDVEAELRASKNDPVLLECMAELYLIKGQPAKALPFYLRLRKPNVFDLIKEYGLFNAVQDQALSLVEFDQDRKRALRIADAVDEKAADETAVALGPDHGKHGAAIELLVEHTHSIPINRTVQQLEARPEYLYMYLDALFDKDSSLCMPFSDRMVELYASFDAPRLMPFLRASNYYDLERAFTVCEERDLVPEMVFLLGRMGNNKQALMLIIERLGDVDRAIDFAKDQADEDLWDDLLSYAETRPAFIRALLERSGAEVDPVRLIRRVRDGLEIEGLKPALVTILQAANLRMNLLRGCGKVLESDGAALAGALWKAQTGSRRGSASTPCAICRLPAFVPRVPRAPALVYLCDHAVHATCALPPDVELPDRPEGFTALALPSASSAGKAARARGMERMLVDKLGYASAVRVRVGRCPVCVEKSATR
ncbi:Vacuolar protein sorting-associated protein 41 [Cryptotrichosporon argae]